MLSKYNILAFLAASSSLLPSLAAAADPVLVPWSKDPKQCFPTYACATDCAAAYKTLCAQVTANKKPRDDHLKLDAQRVVSKSCLAYYHLGSTSGKSHTPFANAAACEAAFAKIVSDTFVNDPKNDPQKCGRPAGAMGYDATGARTATPLFAIMPANGNPNCFRKAGDTSPIPSQSQLPDGTEFKTCQRSTSKRTDLAVRDEPIQDVPGLSILKCAAEDVVTLTACSATCVMTVMTTSWLTGPFAVIAGLGCVGLCDVVANKVADNCLEAEGGDLFKNFFDWSKKRAVEPLTIGAKVRALGERADETSNKCLRAGVWNICDGASENALMKNLGCATTGGGVINT
ncbi:MAG: hypothetical protein M1836_005772 [Candelina mexicana]|nr:MAG: hypothetical protein M1836_005772 [Candelina mexicana]